jgi:predicted dehydrogenase
MAWSRARVGKRRTKVHRVSVIGLGVMGHRHVRVLRALSDRFELAGAYDIRAETEWPAGLRRFGSEVEAIDCAEVVVVSTPIAAHAAIVSHALAAGRHVFVEKPLCATAAEAHALAASASASSRLFVGHSERFNPVVRVLSRLLRDEVALTAELRRVGPSLASTIGVLLNLGVHDLDLAAYLGGGPVSLRGAVGRSRGPDPAEDAAHILFTTSRGTVGHVHVDRTAPVKRRSVSVATPRWAYDGDLLAHRLVRTRHHPSVAGAVPGRHASGAASEVPLPLEEPLLAQAIALADALDGAPAREIATGHDGAAAVALAEQAAALCRTAPHADVPAALLRTPG